MHDRDRIFIDCSTPTSHLRRSASVGTRDRMHGMIQTEAIIFHLFLCNRLSSELRVGCCQYSRAFCLERIFARRALVRSRTPMISCLSNARSGDLHFGTSFVALRALVREIIPNTIPSHPPTHIPKSDVGTYPHDLSRISIDCLTPASRLRRSASV